MLKSAAYVAVLFAVAYGAPRVLDVSGSLPHVPGLPAVESLLPAVIADASDAEPERPRRSRSPADVAAALGPATAGMSAESLSGELRSPTGPASPPRPRALPPVYRSGYVVGGKVAVAIPVADGSISAALERQLATLTEGACRDFGPWTEVEPVNVIPDGTCARYRTVVGEETGEQAVSLADNVVRRDDTPPRPPVLVISEASENAHAGGDTLFYRAAEGEEGTFTVAAVATDPQSGVEQVTFPALGDSSSTSQPGPDAAVRYVWNGSLSTDAPTEGMVVTTNGAGSQSKAPLQIVGDADPPAGGFISYAGGLHRDGRVDVDVGPGDDSASGVDDASGVLEEQDARLAGGRCRGGWGSWHAASDGSPGRPACVRFRYRVADNVGNEATYDSSILAKVVDRVRPTAALVAPADGTTLSGTVTVFGEAEDLGFGVAAVRFEFSRFALCHAQWRTVARVATAPYTAEWATSSLAPGRYRLRAVATDRAGNSSASNPVTIRIADPVTPPPSDEGSEEDDGGDAGDPPTATDDEGGDDVDDEASPEQGETGTGGEAVETSADGEEAPPPTGEEGVKATSSGTGSPMIQQEPLSVEPQTLDRRRLRPGERRSCRCAPDHAPGVDGQASVRPER